MDKCLCERVIFLYERVKYRYDWNKSLCGIGLNLGVKRNQPMGQLVFHKHIVKVSTNPAQSMDASSS